MCRENGAHYVCDSADGGDDGIVTMGRLHVCEASSKIFFPLFCKGLRVSFVMDGSNSCSVPIYTDGAIRHSNSVGLSHGHRMSHDGLGSAIGMMQLPSPSNSDAVLATV